MKLHSTARFKRKAFKTPKSPHCRLQLTAHIQALVGNNLHSLRCKIHKYTHDTPAHRHTKAAKRTECQSARHIAQRVAAGGSCPSPAVGSRVFFIYFYANIVANIMQKR